MAREHKQKKAQQHWDNLTGEHAVGDAGQIVLACLFAATWIADTFFLKCTTFFNQYVPLSIRTPCGVVLLALSGYLAKTGLSIVFGIIRHPVYLSEILLYLGLLMLSISLAAAVVWVIVIGFLHYISRYEERLLLARFGEDYAKYMREVPMWLPRFLKR